MASDKLSVLSLFSGAGGLDFGFEAAGFETRVCVDIDHDSCQTLRHNGDWQVFEGDIDCFGGQRLLFEAGLQAREPDLLIGGPPCQPFSKSGFWVSGDVARLRDPRAATLISYLRLVEETAPQAIFFENVRGFAYAGKAEGLEHLLSGLSLINERLGTNYRPFWTVVQAADYGVPQLRERLILVAERSGASFEFPRPQPEARRSAWDAISDVSPDHGEDLAVRGRWAQLLPSIPEGQNYLWHTSRGGGLPLFGWRRRYWNFLLKLSKGKPAWTLQAQPGPAVGPFHWANRRLSRREMCRLQTFPDTVEVLGSRQAQQRQIGNAVPSLLAEVVAREMAAQFFQRPVSGPPHLLLQRRTPEPTPEPVLPVPLQYLPMIGSHEAHPGTGRGFAYAVRSE
jgi:DNA (cytosine-5)-methyltransferase 1